MSAGTRRLLMSDGGRTYRLFTFAQNSNDASIYISSPGFSSVEWLAFAPSAAPMQPQFAKSRGGGHLSLHGSGAAHIRGDSQHGERTLTVSGNYLMDKTNNLAGVRHLFTAFMTMPFEIVSTHRRSDYVLQGSNPLDPFCMVFIGIPIGAVSRVELNLAFDVREFSMPEKSILGWGLIPLEIHTVLWMAYRTNHMERWPSSTHICYSDGYLVPFVVGTAPQEFRMDMLIPIYTVKEGTLQIQLDATPKTDQDRETGS